MSSCFVRTRVPHDLLEASKLDKNVAGMKAKSPQASSYCGVEATEGCACQGPSACSM